VLKGLAGMLQLVVDHVDHLLEALPQQRIGEICTSFSQAMKPEALGQSGSAEAAQLRQNEPDPVAALATGAQFSQGALVGALSPSALGTAESTDVIGGAEHGPDPRRSHESPRS
jgi:hypothetical protein